MQIALINQLLLKKNLFLLIMQKMVIVKVIKEIRNNNLMNQLLQLIN